MVRVITRLPLRLLRYLDPAAEAVWRACARAITQVASGEINGNITLPHIQYVWRGSNTTTRLFTSFLQLRVFCSTCVLAALVGKLFYFDIDMLTRILFFSHQQECSQRQLRLQGMGRGGAVGVFHFSHHFLPTVSMVPCLAVSVDVDGYRTVMKLFAHFFTPLLTFPSLTHSLPLSALSSFANYSPIGLVCNGSES